MNYTLVVIKPDGILHEKEIMDKLTIPGYRITKLFHGSLTSNDVRMLYAVHIGKPFFNDLTNLMTSGLVSIYVIDSNDQQMIERIRNIIGPTDSNEAKLQSPDSIRALFGKDKTSNAIHSSDSMDSFIKEFMAVCRIVKNRYSNPFVITLDGTAASGKSTTAKELGILFDIAYLNSGSLYRACTCAYLKKMPNVELEGNRIDEASAISIIKSTAINFKPDGNVLIDGSEEDLRTSPITTLVPLISQIPEIRQEVRNLQYKFAETFKKIVADGRDLGTVVFPTAFVKFYIDASVEERAKRRNVDPDELLQRDRLDMSRHESPLKPAQDAIIIDNTHMEVHDTLFHCAIRIILKMSKSLNLNEDFFNIQTKKCIILSGPACSGKTSLIKSLKSDQYYVIEEAAERVIQYYKDNLIPLPWEDPETTELSWMKFQTKIMETQIQDIKTIPNNIQLIVMDRGLEDTQAYYREATGNDMPNWKSTRDLLNTNNVIVYYLNPVCKKNNNVTDNGIRFEEEMEQLKNQYQFIKSEYERYDYNVICEPKLTSLEDRLKVLKKLISRS